MKHHIPSTCPINSNLVDLGRVVAHIFDVTKNMTTPILTNEVSKICSQAHICHSGFVITPLLDWESFEEDEAFAIENLIANRFQEN